MTRRTFAIAIASALGLGLSWGLGTASAEEILPGTIPATIERVIDGDTIEVLAATRLRCWRRSGPVSPLEHAFAWRASTPPN